MAFEVEQLYVLCCATGLVFVVKGEGGIDEKPGLVSRN